MALHMSAGWTFLLIKVQQTRPVRFRALGYVCMQLEVEASLQLDSRQQ